MSTYSIFKTTRRGFLKITSALGVTALFSNPVKLFADASDAVVRNDLNATPNEAAATGHLFDLIDFAHVSDVHIADEGNPLRFEELKLLGLVPIGFNYVDPIVQSISRDQDPYSVAIWNEVIRSVNDGHNDKPLAFLIATGDHTDTGLETELKWFIQVADGGCTPDDLEGYSRYAKNVLFPNGTRFPGLKMPWYGTLGNHDTQYEGNTVYADLLIQIATVSDTSDVCHQSEVIEEYRKSDSQSDKHGFAIMPDPYEGYYSFSPGPYVHCIVINTSNYESGEYVMSGEASAMGMMDRRQFDWMIGQIEANSDKICLVFSHHRPSSLQHGLVPIESEVSNQDLMDAFCKYENVIANISGHAHYNQVDPVSDDNGSYWDINTCSSIDWPQEWRRITIKDNGNGTGVISCRMIRHTKTEYLDIAYNDLGADTAAGEGEPGDRDVDLVFAMPATVARKIRATYNSDVVDECFIATAAYGSLMEPEVVLLRKFRDTKLKPYLFGRLLVRLYYRISPPIAAFISQRSWMKTFVRRVLRPLVKGLRIMGDSSTLR